MTFGYLGYVWALLGCSIFTIVLGGSAAFLYVIARRERGGGVATRHVVETVPLDRETSTSRRSD